MTSLLISRRGALAFTAALALLGLLKAKPYAAAPGRIERATPHELTPWRGDAAARFARHAALRVPERHLQ